MSSLRVLAKFSSSELLYPSFFLASARLILSLCATFITLSAKACLSSAVPPSHCVSERACIFISSHPVPVPPHLYSKCPASQGIPALYHPLALSIFSCAGVTFPSLLSPYTSIAIPLS